MLSRNRFGKAPISFRVLLCRCLLSHCYSLWFISFPAFVHTHPKKLEALRIGFAVMQKMHNAKLPFVDQVGVLVLSLIHI